MDVAPRPSVETEKTFVDVGMLEDPNGRASLLLATAVVCDLRGDDPASALIPALRAVIDCLDEVEKSLSRTWRRRQIRDQQDQEEAEAEEEGEAVEEEEGRPVGVDQLTEALQRTEEANNGTAGSSAAVTALTANV